MTALIWVFAISLFLIILMISYRMYEITTGRSIISATKKADSDKFILAKIDQARFFFDRIRQRISGLFLAIPHRFNVFLHRIWNNFSDKVDKYFDKLRGRRDIGKKSRISLYWQELSRKDLGKNANSNPEANPEANTEPGDSEKKAD